MSDTQLSYQELQAKIAELKQAAEAARKQEFGAAISEIKERMAVLGITVEDLIGRAPKARRSTGAVAAKFRNPATGKTWSGRGRTPAWISEHEAAGGKREDLAA